MEEIKNLEEVPYWQNKGFSYFCNRACEYYPCHHTEEDVAFNCLFCYCPLYVLGRDCGGTFSYLPNGVKDCSAYLLPHRRENYGCITDRFQEITKVLSALESKPPEGA